MPGSPGSRLGIPQETSSSGAGQSASFTDNGYDLGRKPDPPVRRGVRPASLVGAAATLKRRDTIFWFSVGQALPGTASGRVMVKNASN